MEKYTALELTRIRASNYNPRVVFDEAKLQELADSILEKGVLEPILVRPIGKGTKGTADSLYEIVAGERRYRAARLAKLTTIPAIVRTLDDQAAAEIAIIENAQRANLTPVEEARGIQTLIERFGYTADDAAAKMGLSPKTVHHRLALLRLPKDALVAIEAGTLSLGSAAHLSRIPNEKLRVEATKSVLHGNFHTGHEALGPKPTFDLIRRDYITELSAATFPVNDATLVPEAGSCGQCLQRSGNQQDLFPGKKDKNLCLNTACFAAKKAAYRKRVLEEAKAEGIEVITGSKVKKIFPYGNHLGFDAAYVEASETYRDYSNPKSKPVTYQKLLGKVVETVMAVDPSGSVRTLYPKAAVKVELKKLGLLKSESQAGLSTRYQKSEAEKKRERELKADRLALLESLNLARVSAKAFVPKFATPGQRSIWKTLATGYLGRIWDDDLKLLCTVMEIPIEKQGYTSGTAKAINDWLTTATDEDAYVCCLVLSLIRLSHGSDEGRRQPMLAGFDALEINFGEIRAGHLKVLTEKAESKQKGSKTAKTRKRSQQQAQA